MDGKRLSVAKGGFVCVGRGLWDIQLILVLFEGSGQRLQMNWKNIRINTNE
jgi:hypothetical protein